MPGTVDTRLSAYPLRAVDRVCDVLDVLASNPAGTTLSAIAAATALPKSSAFRYLAALEVRGYVGRTDDGYGYRLAPAARLRRGGHPERLERLLDSARPLMARLVLAETGAFALAALDGVGVRILWAAAPRVPDHAVPRVGSHGMIHSSAVGKAIAGQLSDDAVLQILTTAGMPARTVNTLITPTAFLRELHRVRGEGFAVSDQERFDDVRGVAVPIGGEPMALGMSMRAEQLTPDRIVGSVRQLRRAAVVLARVAREGPG